MEIRLANEADLPQLLAIYNEVIATTTAIFSEKPVSLSNRRRWWRKQADEGNAVLVASDEAAVLGFATFGNFRDWPCYRFTVEHSVHVRSDRRGEGIGTRLVESLFPRAAALDKHIMVAGIEAANRSSIRMHERLGFAQVAHFREVGRKFDRWLDLVFMQRSLDAFDTRRPPPLAPAGVRRRPWGDRQVE